MEIEFRKVSNDHLHNINFQIEQGSIIGITGNDKAILLKMIAHEISFEGEGMYRSIPYDNSHIYEIKKEISLIEETFQSFSFASTVEEYIAFFLRYYKLNISDPRKKIISALKMVGLKEDDLEKELATLSTSEQKLLQIASSLLSNPTVLLLDEPFINLDLKAQKKLERLLIKLKERYKKTIIIASHDSNLLYSLTDKLLLLKNGTILKQGKTKEIYQNVKYLLRYHYEIPDIVLFTYKAKEIKSAKIDYHKDIRDLIKDIYKHV